MQREFTIIIEEGEDGYFVSEVVELEGCHTQAKNLDELLKRTKEAIHLCLSVAKEDSKVSSKKFVGIQKLAV